MKALGLVMFLIAVGYAVVGYLTILWFANLPHRPCGRCKKGGPRGS